jgi:hypothetical protein
VDPDAFYLKKCPNCGELSGEHNGHVGMYEEWYCPDCDWIWYE